jgi:pilus assembly protein CpaB
MFLFAAVALLVAAGVTAYTYRFLSQAEPVDDTTQIVVAALPVSVGSRLTEADLRVSPWPKAMTIDGSFEKISDVVGRGVVVPLIPNEPVLTSKLAASGSGAGLMATIPDGMRAVSVKVNDVIGVAGFVVPGSRVDVILSGSPTESGSIEMAKVILENVQVLAAGQNIESDEKGKPMSAQVVTLLVTPDESQKLALASIDGKIQLALRNPLDLAQMNPNAVRREHLFAGATAAPLRETPPAPRLVTRPVPRKAPSLPAPVEPQAAIAPPAPAAASTIAPVAAPVVAAPHKHVVRVIQGNRQETVSFDGTEEGATQ